MSATTVDRDLVSRFAPLFDELGRDAVERERERRLPYAEVEALRAAGFTRVTLPHEHGGEGATHGEFFELLAELARRDPNLAQLFRSHFSYIDRTLHAPSSDDREARLARLSDGAIVGNASHERSTAKVGSLATRLTRTPEGLRLNGTKFYSTGTLFADLVGVAAEEDGEFVSVLVDTGAPGVDRIDDWTGFGQRLTGSGTTVFTDVAVDPSTVVRREPDRPSHGGAFVQLVLLAAVTGIGRAIVDDAAAFVRARTRTYSHGAAATAQGDPIVQEVVGELSAKSFAADAALVAATTALERSSRAILDGDPERIPVQLAAVELATARAQLVILPAVLDAATALFDVGGASAVETHLALDRHWRNARTIASHNPARFKARAIGDHLVNGTPIVSWWSTGEA
ncbi:acyl-CoA dehydrogenase family protein [Plantibacter sp. LMC-P-059a]|jgi:alkylation response protein AidB-like acyl-CoA dehydrogenase|uniref:acyl-CoA dehydrogenase family protein n=1 Tax=Plantibacter sp. LMC-P-059a TaxID=3040297 RepID=UPI0025502D7F|nr:acyl-CoA dehydrogenase family protein [Plantibacter sp. LMC-P-059a]